MALKFPLSKFPQLRKIRASHRAAAIQEAQKAITEYLHSTRSFPFLYADNIVKNASFSLSSFISQIPFHPSSFRPSLHTFLRYHPINEFHFFYESIGVKVIHPPATTFLNQDFPLFSAACALAQFGFPWNKVGVLCGKVDFFSVEDAHLVVKRLSEIKGRFGFSNMVVVGICLAFPRVLADFGEFDGLLRDLRNVLLSADLVDYVKGNVDATYQVCRKFRVFYELGGEKGVFGELLVRNRNILIDYTEEDLVRKIEFFCRLGVDKEQVGLLLLSKPDILKFDLEDRVISVSSFLKHLNLSEEKLEHVELNYPYVLGKNRMVNVPHIVRAMDLSEWFFDTIKLGDHSLLATYANSNENEDADDDGYQNYLQISMSGKSHAYNTSRLDFLHGIGFGENKYAMKTMSKLYGSSSQLYRRFNLLLSRGIKFSKLCEMVSLNPKILNRDSQVEGGLPLSENANGDSCTVTYLNDKYGFSRDEAEAEAVSASKYVNFDKPDKPDVCLSFFKNRGFTDTQLSKMLRKCPILVTYAPEKTFLPKVEFLISKGFLRTEISALLVLEPSILCRSLEGHLVPTFDLIKDQFGSVETTVKAIKRCPRFLLNFQDTVLPNIQLLKEAGVSNCCVVSALLNQSHLLCFSRDNIQELVDNIKKLGMKPESYNFMKGVYVMGGLSRLAWKNKLKVYKRWECSEEEVLTAFKKEPYCMKISEEKIDVMMDFFVYEMGWRPQMLLLTPTLFTRSLQKGIIPRCSVYKVLLSKGLLKVKCPSKVKASIVTIVICSEEKFLAKFVNCYPDQASELLRLYEEKKKNSN